MERDSLKPNQLLILEFEPHRRNPKVVFEVASNIPITTYLVDDMGMEDFRDGKTPEYYAGYANRRNHQAALSLPEFSRYYLIIHNKSEGERARIEYDLKVR